jgi:hypothetical protein
LLNDTIATYLLKRDYPTPLHYYPEPLSLESSSMGLAPHKYPFRVTVPSVHLQTHVKDRLQRHDTLLTAQG